jgi:hypothetical protein
MFGASKIRPERFSKFKMFIRIGAAEAFHTAVAWKALYQCASNNNPLLPTWRMAMKLQLGAMKLGGRRPAPSDQLFLAGEADDHQKTQDSRVDRRVGR